MEITLNDIKLYYEKTGEGSPVILIHGNGEDHRIFDSLLPHLAERYTVYALDSRGHGKSEKGLLGYRIMARDVMEFIEAEGLIRPAIIGFSDGGIIALMVAAELKEKVDSIVVAGANLRPYGIKRRWLRLFSLGYLFTRSEYLKLMIKEPDIEDAELNAIKARALVLAGEKDLIEEEHTKKIANEIPGAELKIIKGATHSSYVKDGDKFYSIISAFLAREGV